MSLPQLTIDNQQLTIDKSKKGFSLVELLIVMSIIGILVSFGSASWTNAQQKSRDARRKSDLKAIQQALETFYQQYGSYPYSVNGGHIGCSTPAGDNPWGSAFTCNSITFMQLLPSDPIYSSDASRQYFYLPIGGLYKYAIHATLENTSDPDRATHPCPVTLGNRNYCETNP